MKTRIALFIAALVATGCAQLPLSGGTYVGTYQEPVGKVCDPTGWWCQPVYAPAPAVQTVPAQMVAPVSTSTIIFFQVHRSYGPPFYHTPSSSSCCWNNKGGKWWRW